MSNYIKDNIDKKIEYLANLGIPRKKIAKKLNLCVRTIEIRCKKANIKLTNNKRKPNLNKDFFKNITSEEQAYILGFVYADGYIDCQEKSLVINMSKKDIDILYKIKNALQCKNPIHKSSTKNCVRLNLCSKEMVKDLKEIGVCRAKSKIIRLPQLPNNLYKHFFRGYCDGNGHVGKAQVIVCTGSQKFYEDMIKFFSEKFNKKISVREQHNCWYIVFSRKDLDIVDWLYSESNIYIDRKYKSYLDNWVAYAEKRRNIG